MHETLMNMLSAETPEQLSELFAKARAVRKKHFENKVFLYGFVYFSTICRNNCTFCYYRSSNNIERYRKTPDEVVSMAKSLADSGVHLIDLTMGEDPEYHRDFTPIFSIAQKIRQAANLPIMLSPGVMGRDIIDKAANMGIEWFALYQETHNRRLFTQLRCGQDYDKRMEAKHYAAQKGIFIEEGILTGIGETYEDIADSIIKMGEIGAKQMRVMSFIPQKGSPMEHIPKPDLMRELKIIAAIRITYPNVLIPASLDIDGIGGLKRRINAGANVVTSIIPPNMGFSGVAQVEKDIDGGGRTVAQIVPILKELGMGPATAKEYKEWLKSQ